MRRAAVRGAGVAAFAGELHGSAASKSSVSGCGKQPQLFITAVSRACTPCLDTCMIPVYMVTWQVALKYLKPHEDGANYKTLLKALLKTVVSSLSVQVGKNVNLASFVIGLS